MVSLKCGDEMWTEIETVLSLWQVFIKTSLGCSVPTLPNFYLQSLKNKAMKAEASFKF